MDTKTMIYKPLIHKHSLFYSARSKYYKCSVCKQIDNFYGGYFCNTLGCFIWLHKECAEIPLEINHPSHPEHPIVLTNDVKDSTQHNYGECNICGILLLPLHYSCSTCDEFKVDITCGMKMLPPAIKHMSCQDHLIILKNIYWNYCEVCKENLRGESFYSCTKCKVKFHVRCASFSEEVNHPCHSNHPLKFTEMATLLDAKKTCILCGSQPKVCYYCSLCNFTTCLLCTSSPPPLIVEDIKTHQHPLIRLSKKISYICDVCGLKCKEQHYGSYICHQCDFVIHGRCIGLPRVININRHVHRIYFTQLLGSGYSECGVCHQSISQYHGAYTCSVCPKYAVHARCSIDTHSVWDGVELEGIPDDTEDISPYKVVDNDLINHVSHVKHNLKLHKNYILYDHEWIRCAACIDPVGYSSIYVCEECCFVLHEKCANLPTKRKHLFDTVPYMLEVDDIGAANDCRLCGRVSVGFKYSAGPRKGKIDVRCCSLSEPFVHACHPHPLYVHKDQRYCDACTILKSGNMLRCAACNFYLCLFCATLPLMIRHKYHEHSLNLYCGEKTSGENWCDICERKLDPSLWFYTCFDCGVTLHVRCVVEELSRVNARSTIIFKMGKKIFEAVPNNRSTRPLCSWCHSRCKSSIIIKKNDEDNVYFCSRTCFKRFLSL